MPRIARTLEEIVTANGDRITPIDTATGKAELAEALEKSRAAFALVDHMWDEVKATRAIAEVARSAASKAADVAQQCLEAIRRKSIPPMRPPADSQVLAMFEQIKEAAVRGEKDPNSTPDKELEPLLEVLLERRAGRRIIKLATWLAGLAVTAYVSAIITMWVTKGH